MCGTSFLLSPNFFFRFLFWQIEHWNLPIIDIFDCLFACVEIYFNDKLQCSHKTQSTVDYRACSPSLFISGLFFFANFRLLYAHMIWIFFCTIVRVTYCSLLLLLLSAVRWNVRSKNCIHRIKPKMYRYKLVSECKRRRRSNNCAPMT